jgi:hypothetical protein
VHANGQISDAVARGRGLWTALGLAEEGGAFVGIVAELMTENAKAPAE